MNSVTDLNRPLYKLDDDAWAGFKTAVNNSQTRLALEYAIKVIEELQTQIDELKARPTSVTNNSVAPSRKTTKATTETAQDDGSNE